MSGHCGTISDEPEIVRAVWAPDDGGEQSLIRLVDRLPSGHRRSHVMSRDGDHVGVLPSKLGVLDLGHFSRRFAVLLLELIEPTIEVVLHRAGATLAEVVNDGLRL